MGKLRGEKKVRFRSWFRNASLRAAFVASILIALVTAIVITLITEFYLSEQVSSITYYYVAQYDKPGMTEEEQYQAYNYRNYSDGDQQVIETARVAAVVLPVLFFVFSIVGASMVFFRVKLKPALSVLEDSAARISHNDLDFTIEYQSEDEMGELCRAFESMRGELERSNRSMWRMMEERKRLNAAFAHDLRTPLTVLRGYSEFLREYAPKGRVSEEKLYSTLSVMAQHVERLESYVSTMNTAQSLEDIKPERRLVALTSLLRLVTSNAEVLSREYDREIAVINKVPRELTSLFLDEKIVLQVFENMMANAMRYARNRVEVSLFGGWQYFCICVADDGKGFTPEELQMATEAFYKDKASSNSQHFGLGLNICKVLTGLHGGWISLSNHEKGGAMVTANFCVAVDEK